MSSPRKSGLVSQRSLTRQATKAGDPWCLACGVNLALDGRTFTVLSHLHHGELCEMIPRVLGVEFSEQYPSVNLCNRCERQIRRLGRYNSIILARHEGQKLRNQLIKNLAKHGSSAVESGESLDVELAEANEQPKRTTTRGNGSSPSQLRKGQSVDGYSPPKRREFSSISPTRKSRKHVSVTEEGAEPPFGQDGNATGARKQGSHTGAAKRRESPTKENDRRSGSASRRVKTGPGEKPAPASPIPGDRKFATKARGIALVKRATTSPRDAQKVDNRPQVAPKPRKPRGINAQSQRSQEEETKEPEYQRSGSPPDHFDEADVDMASNGDKKALVERSESVENEKPREKLKVKRFFSLGFLSNNDKDSNKKNGENSPVDGTNDSEQKPEDPRAAGDQDNQDKTNGEADPQDPHWSKRVNPFDGEEQKSTETGNLEVAGGVVDDEVASDEYAKQCSMARSVSEQVDEELLNRLEKTKFGASVSEHSESEEEKVDPNDYNADTRSSLSEVEERINIKSQFRGAYYNIGSTEDLLAELTNEQEADKARLANLREGKDSDGTGKSKSEKGQSDKPRQKGGNNQDNVPLINSADEGGEAESNAAEEEPIELSQRNGTQSAPGDAKGTEGDHEGTPGSDTPNDQGSTNVETRDKDGAGDSAKNADGTEKDSGGVSTDSQEPSVKIGKSKEGKAKVTFAADTSSDRVEEDEPHASHPQTEDGSVSTSKTEKSPLIGPKPPLESAEPNVQKDSKFKDQQPGFLCCTIL